MKDINYLWKLARQCRDLEKTVTAPEVIEQLRIWATELDEITENLKSRPVEHEMAE